MPNGIMEEEEEEEEAEEEEETNGITESVINRREYQAALYQR